MATKRLRAIITIEYDVDTKYYQDNLEEKSIEEVADIERQKLINDTYLISLKLAYPAKGDTSDICVEPVQ